MGGGKAKRTMTSTTINYKIKTKMVQRGKGDNKKERRRKKEKRLHRAKQHLKCGQITTKVGEAAALGNLRNPKPREEGTLLTLKTASIKFSLI